MCHKHLRLTTSAILHLLLLFWHFVWLKRIFWSLMKLTATTWSCWYWFFLLFLQLLHLLGLLPFKLDFYFFTIHVVLILHNLILLLLLNLRVLNICFHTHTITTINDENYLLWSQIFRVFVGVQRIIRYFLDGLPNTKDHSILIGLQITACYYLISK